MRHATKSNRSKSRLSRNARWGGQIESLESRQMMFGDDVLGGPLGPPEIVIDPNLDFEIPGGIVRSDECIDFEDMPAGGSYVVGDSFIADNTGLQAKFTGEAFTWSGGGMTVGGSTTVDHSNHAGHLGQDMMVNNILLDIDFGGTVHGVTLHFGEYGGNLNLEVNGDFRNFEDFRDIDGLNIGGVNATVVSGGFGDDAGRLTLSGAIHSLKLGGQELWIDHICARDIEQQEFDWGDAPDKPYPTLAMNAGAHHRIDPNVFLGRMVEGEADGQPTLASDGDDQVAGGHVDDEDGVRFLTPLIPGHTATVEVIASTDGWLNSWIDFNRNGHWETAAPEQIFKAQPLAAGINVLSFMVPASAQPGPNDPTYSRWRFSTTDRVLTPHQSADTPTPNGEVEDHLVFIADRDPEGRFDFGDAPDQPYPTLLASDGARHRIDPKVYLGKQVDADPNGQPTFLARGDDLNDGNDDEDGVRFLTPMVPGLDTKVEVVASVDGFLDAWVDLNQDGKWDPAEQIATSEFLVAGSNVIDFVVPAGSIPHPTRPVYSRFRFSTDGGLTPRGEAKNGEVEDYATLNGDMNDDGKITAEDIDRLCHIIHSGDVQGDLNGDGQVNDGDMDYLVHDILGTSYGDANLDGAFNSGDLVQVFGSGEFEDGIANNSGWATGDWNCDGEFTSADLVKAMQDGSYSTSAVAANASTPIVESKFMISPEVENSRPAADKSDAPSPQESPQGKRRLLEVQWVEAVFSDDDSSGSHDSHSSQDDGIDDLAAAIAFV